MGWRDKSREVIQIGGFVGNPANMKVLPVLAVFAVVFQGVSSLSACPSGWTLNGNVCYWYSGDLMKSWSSAEDYCNTQGGQLASFYNSSDLAIASKLITNNLYSTWSGLYRNGASWYWVDNSPYSSFRAPWLIGEPTPNAGGCGAIRTNAPSGLYALPCTYNQPFMCRQFSANCVPTTNNASSGNITSPGYPKDYTNNLDCAQFITTDPRRFIELEFDVWIVENKYDYVNIYNGHSTSPNNLIAHVASDPTAFNSTIKNSFQTTTNVMTVLFHTDSTTTKRGWTANYRTVANAPDVYQNGSSGHVTSNNYPKDYDDFTEQYFYITAPAGVQISLNFDYFDTETDKDYLVVYDAPTADANYVIGNFSGHINRTLPAMPGPLSSTNNTMTLFFKTDYSLHYHGWSAMWNIF